MNPTLKLLAWLYLGTGLIVAFYLWVSDGAQTRLSSIRAVGGFAFTAGFTAVLFIGLWPVWLVLIWLALRKEKASKIASTSRSDEKNA